MALTSVDVNEVTCAATSGSVMIVTTRCGRSEDEWNQEQINDRRIHQHQEHETNSWGEEVKRRGWRCGGFFGSWTWNNYWTERQEEMASVLQLYVNRWNFQCLCHLCRYCLISSFKLSSNFMEQLLSTDSSENPWWSSVEGWIIVGRARVTICEDTPKGIDFNTHKS